MTQEENWQPFWDREPGERVDKAIGYKDMYRKGIMEIVTPTEEAFSDEGQRIMPG